jgi:hypothetical protein
MNKKTTSSIEKNVMSQIQAGKIKMRPKIYFSIIGALSIAAAVFLGFVSMYFASVVTLWLRVQAAQGPAYGARRNLDALISAFPWWALIIGAISLSFMIYFVRKIGNLYKIRLLYIAILSAVALLLIGFLLSYGSLPNTFNRHDPAFIVNNIEKIK